MTLLAGTALLASCVSLEEARLAPGAVRPGQKTVLLLYAGPGPLVSAADSNVESAAKIVPGLGLVVQSAQDDRDLAASKDLARYLPAWTPESAFYPRLQEALAVSGHPGAFIAQEQTDVPADSLRKLNEARDALDWRNRYFLPGLEGAHGRNYAAFLSLDDALIFEVNLLYGVASDEQGLMVPILGAAVKLLRPATLKTLWRQEFLAEDKPAAKSLYDFKAGPAQLTANWEKMMPELAQKIAAGYRDNLQKAGAYKAPAVAVPAQQGLPPGGD
ncbi:MAG: hypothetical protein HY921_05130 [Elusimicrobia bacterium]|nr:hypothetical protein [Elusimicrobiota bacterium]